MIVTLEEISWAAGASILGYSVQSLWPSAPKGFTISTIFSSLAFLAVSFLRQTYPTLPKWSSIAVAVIIFLVCFVSAKAASSSMKAKNASDRDEDESRSDGQTFLQTHSGSGHNIGNIRA